MNLKLVLEGVGTFNVPVGLDDIVNGDPLYGRFPMDNHYTLVVPETSYDAISVPGGKANGRYELEIVLNINGCTMTVSDTYEIDIFADSTVECVEIGVPEDMSSAGWPECKKLPEKGWQRPCDIVSGHLWDGDNGFLYQSFTIHDNVGVPGDDYGFKY